MNYKVLEGYPSETPLPILYSQYGMVKATNLQQPSMHSRWLLPEKASDFSMLFKYKRLHCLTQKEIDNPSTVPEEFKRSGIAISMATYKRKVKSPGAKRENICGIKMIAVDCDYSDKLCKTPLEVFSILRPELEGEKILPSIVETGHRLRLIYILKDSVAIPFNEKREKILTLLDRITEELTKRCNIIGESRKIKLCAEPQKLTSYIRPHGAYNEKDGSEITWYVTDEVYTIDELSSLLPPLPTWYDEWVKKSAAGKKNPVGIHASNINERRVSDLISIIDDIHVGKREKFLFVLYNQLLLLHKNETIAQEELIKYNEKLHTPIEAAKVNQHVFNRCNKTYTFRDETIRQWLDLSADYCEEKQILIGQTNAEKCKAYHDRKYKVAREKKAGLMIEAKQLHENGHSLRNIAKLLGISKSTAERWVNNV